MHLQTCVCVCVYCIMINASFQVSFLHVTGQPHEAIFHSHILSCMNSCKHCEFQPVMDEGVSTISCTENYICVRLFGVCVCE